MFWNLGFGPTSQTVKPKAVRFKDIVLLGWRGFHEEAEVGVG